MSFVNLIKKGLKNSAKKGKNIYHDRYACNGYQTIIKIKISSNGDKIWNCTLTEITENANCISEDMNSYSPVINEETISIINDAEPTLITIVKEFGMEDDGDMKDFLRDFFIRE